MMRLISSFAIKNTKGSRFHLYQVEICFGKLYAPLIVANKNLSPDVIGTIQLRMFNNMPGYAGFANLWVHADQRNKGLGTHLIHLAKKWGLERKAKYLAGCIDPENLDVVPFYEKLGFSFDPANNNVFIKPQ